MTANLVIFLGLLYTVFHMLGFLGLLHGYHLTGLVIALSLLGLGYGIRYGSSACLYVATALCAGLGLYFGVLVAAGWAPYHMLRLALSIWALWRLYRAIPGMKLLQQEQAFPLPMSRYGAFLLRHRPRRTTRQK
jgi:hypothetical protein